MTTRKSLESGLHSIESAIAEQSENVEAMVRSAYRGLCERCLGTADEVMVMETVINSQEVQIEEKCLALIALQQPVALDLRRTAGALKINADLERIADLALNLAERTESLADYPTLVVPTDLSKMVKLALSMLHDAKEAFLINDATLAADVIKRDSELDEMNRCVIADLVQQMADDPDNVSGYLHTFSASRIVERMGDHACNIAEDVEFIVRGEITRHSRH